MNTVSSVLDRFGFAVLLVTVAASPIPFRVEQPEPGRMPGSVAGPVPAGVCHRPKGQSSGSSPLWRSPVRGDRRRALRGFSDHAMGAGNLDKSDMAPNRPLHWRSRGGNLRLAISTPSFRRVCAACHRGVHMRPRLCARGVSIHDFPARPASHQLCCHTILSGSVRAGAQCAALGREEALRRVIHRHLHQPATQPRPTSA